MDNQIKDVAEFITEMSYRAMTKMAQQLFVQLDGNSRITATEPSAIALWLTKWAENYIDESESA